MTQITSQIKKLQDQQYLTSLLDINDLENRVCHSSSKKLVIDGFKMDDIIQTYYIIKM